jgi:hypothetical protein
MGALGTRICRSRYSNVQAPRLASDLACHASVIDCCQPSFWRDADTNSGTAVPAFLVQHEVWFELSSAALILHRWHRDASPFASRGLGSVFGSHYCFHLLGVQSASRRLDSLERISGELGSATRLDSRSGGVAAHVRGTDCIFTGSGDVNGVFREAGIPLGQTLTVDNGLMWDAARTRPDLFLRCQWAVALMTPGGRSDGDRVGRALNQTQPRGPKYELVKRIDSQDGKVLEVFRRSSATYR